MEFITTIQNVRCKIGYVGEPKGKGGYSYALSSKDIPPEYLDGKYKSIYLQSFDKEPRFSKGQEVTIADLGISSWASADNEVKYSAHIIDKKPSIKEMFNKEVGRKEPLKESHNPSVPSDQVKTPANTPNHNTEKMWADKEKREHKRALTMQAFSLFPPITNESKETAMDRWLKVKAIRDCMLTDLYND